VTDDTPPITRPTPLPQGVVTFLFTDIEGSTRLLEAHREAAGAILARHHEILEAAVTEHDGVVFETVGDAVYGAFAKPLDALLAAVGAQRRLAAEPWSTGAELRVRMAVHSGAVEVRGSHYYGAALFECARIQALAHGGQTLASATTAGLAAADLPPHVSMRPLGSHRLKDLEAPMDIVQVEANDLRRTFPPLRAAASPTNLPHQATTFIGREDDLRRIASLLTDHRLVSLLGPGGTGKTRLALHAAAAALEQFRDGVWLAELAPVTTPEQVLTQVAEVWGLRPGHTTSLEDVVRRYLGERRLMLVLDNCEHVREGAAAVAHSILRDAPDVTILATSRESLGVAGETEYRVSTLAQPADGAVEDSDAGRLFLDRIRSVRPDLEVTPADLDGIARLCRRLEGLPLGLELAAARVRTLSPAEVAERVDSSFLTLSTTSKSALPRQRTLSATLDWSHDLLTDAERVVFRRLSILAGSFDLAAAEHVGRAGAFDGDVLEVLESLVDKSLVLTIPGTPTRFRLLEPVRQYARRHLEAAGEEARIAAAQAEHYAAFVAEAAPFTRGPEQMPWERRIDVEYPNIRLALEHLLLRGDTERYLGIGFDLFVYWMHVGMHVDGIATLRAGLDRIESSAPVTERELQAWFAASVLLAQITDPAGIEHARRGLERARQSGDPNAIGRLELGLGAAIRHSTDDPEYLEHLLEARRLLDDHPQPHWWEPGWEAALVDFILAAYLPADESRSEAHVEGALAGFRDAGDEAQYAAALAETVNHWDMGKEEALMANLGRAIELMRPMRLPYWSSHARFFRGSLLQMQGDEQAALVDLEVAATELEAIGDLSCWATATRRLATARAANGDVDGAREPLAKTIDALPVLPLAEAGVPRSLDTAAEVLLAMGRDREAAVVLGRSRATPFDVDTVLPREPVLDRLQEQLTARLGAGTLAESMAKGADASSEEILERAVAWLRTA